MKKRGRRTQNLASGKESLLKVAQQHFGTFGFDGSTLRGIAKQADVDMALIHHTFGSKLGLWTAVIQGLAADLAAEDQFFASLKSDGAIAERFSAFLDWFLARCSESPYIHLIVLQESILQGERFQIMMDLLLNPLFAEVEPLFTSAIAAGYLPACEAAEAFVFVLNMLSSQVSTRDTVQALKKGKAREGTQDTVFFPRQVLGLMGSRGTPVHGAPPVSTFPSRLEAVPKPSRENRGSMRSVER